MTGTDNTNDLQTTYFKEINEYPLLTAQEEIDLARRVGRGDEEARRKLILSNLKLVITIAKSYIHYNVPFLDLIEEGNLGLIKAVSRYDPERGFRFSTYASWWIRQAVVRAISTHSRTIRIPIHIFQLMTKYVALEGELREYTLEERAKKLDISVKRFRMLERLVRNIKALDLANSIETFNELSKSGEFEGGASPEKIILQQIENEELASLLERLSEREKLILRIRYGFEDGEPHTLAETGKVVNVSRERVRQLEMRALKKLKLLLEPSEKSNPKEEEAG